MNHNTEPFFMGSGLVLNMFGSVPLHLVILVLDCSEPGNPGQKTAKQLEQVYSRLRR